MSDIPTPLSLGLRKANATDGGHARKKTLKKNRTADAKLLKVGKANMGITTVVPVIFSSPPSPIKDLNGDADADADADADTLQKDHTTPIPSQNSRLTSLKSQTHQTFLAKLYLFLEDETSSPLASHFNNFITISILSSIIVVCVETMDGPNHYNNPGAKVETAKYPFLASENTYDILEIVFTVIFSVELVMRLLAADCFFYRHESEVRHLKSMGVVAGDENSPFFRSLMNWADLVAVLPFYIMLPLNDENKKDFAQMVGFAKAIRSLRIFKLSRQFEGSEILSYAISKSIAPLGLPLFFFFLFTFVFGALIFFVEPCYNYETCKFPDIFVSCYFSMVTMTTVGYGDNIPTTMFSRAVATMIMLFGALFLSMPVAIVGSEFNQAWEKLEKIEGKDDNTLKQEMHEFEMRKKRLGVNLLTRLYKNGSKMNKRQVLNMIERVTDRVLHQESQIENAETVSDTRFYLYETYLKISDHINAIYDLISLQGLTVERIEWVLDVLSSCSSLMAKVITISAAAGENSGMSNQNLASQIRESHGDNVEGVRKKTQHGHGQRGTGRGTFSAKHGQSPQTPSSPSPINSPSSPSSSNGSPRQGQDRRSSGRRTSRSFYSAEERMSSGPGARAARPTLDLSKVAESLRDLNEDKPRSKTAQGVDLGLNDDQLRQLRNQNQAKLVQRGTLASVANVLQDSVNKTKSAFHSAGSNAEEKNFVQFICDAMYNDSLRDRLWLLLEVPESSRRAKFLQFFMINVIIFSIALFMMESIPQFTTYRENSLACMNVVEMYCEDKYSNFELNPGCFVYNTSVPLQFGCQDADCFGVGRNFGTGLYGNKPTDGDYFTCESFVSDDTLTTTEGRPFASQDMLPHINDFTWLAENMNGLHDICYRQECNNLHYSWFDFTPMFMPLEAFFAFVFTLEVILRAFVSRNILKFLFDPMNLLDIASVAPFYVEVLISFSNSKATDFRISGADSAGIMLLKILKVTRVFKMTRHFSGTLVLSDTFKRSLNKLYIPFFMLTLITTVFALLFYVVEGGTTCFVGSECDLAWPDDDIIGNLPEGKRVMVTQYGDNTSLIPDAMHSLFFVLVTITSVGYGDMYPKTMMGKSINILLMMFGTLYLSMPLTIVGGQFISSYRSMQETDRLFEVACAQTSELSVHESEREVTISRKLSRGFKSYKVKMPQATRATIEEYRNAREKVKEAYEVLDTQLKLALDADRAALEEKKQVDGNGKSPEEIIVAAVADVLPILDQVSRRHLRFAPVVRYCDRILISEEAKAMVS
ncbi:hypothetical protein TL16_g04122 [Triparma laevis f. inornata]|uniref:Ion transport domain-containing protein n=1 Tax=Triparma laevis f. inornata TaxID=1714386 RepID=A0A9W7E765_9STRA|nr:hypothetical protein TL16_g04122 [Triparma laevis f. inornata]